MRNQLIVPFLSVSLVMALVAFLIPNWVEPRMCSAKSACIANLKQIDGAKATWALEKNVTNNEVEPTASDLYGPTAYIRDVPVCEQGGGKYTIGRLSEKPRCSIPHHSLELGHVYVLDVSNQPLTEATVFVLGAVSNMNSKMRWENTWSTTESNGFCYVDSSAAGATGLAAFKAGYTTSSVPLTTTWPAKLVLKGLPE